MRERFKRSYEYISRARKEKDDSTQIKVPDDLAEYMEFYDTGIPFNYEVKLITNQTKSTTGIQQEGSRQKINRLALILAFYLSKFDKAVYCHLGFTSFSQAFEELSDKIGIKRNSLKNLRDQFDSVNDNGRVGWYQRPLAPSRQKIAEYFSDWSEENLRNLIIGILEGDEEKLAEYDEHLNKLGGVVGLDVDDLTDNTESYIQYWIFQGNPKYYDVVSAVNDLDHITWSTKQYAKEIKQGNRAYIWLSGADGGIVATGTILCDPEMKTPDPNDPYYKAMERNGEPYLGVDIRIDRKLTDAIVTRKLLLADERTKDLVVLKAPNATNFRVTPMQADVIESIIAGRYERIPAKSIATEALANKKQYWMYAPGEGSRLWDEFYAKGIMAIGEATEKAPYIVIHILHLVIFIYVEY